jgi:GNAT superfamily N-acetyltransferase
MFQDHWDEVQITGLTGDLNINYEYLQYLTEIGCLYSTGVEKDGEAIAYFLVSRNTNMLQRDKATAQAVVLYVNPKYRKSWVSMNLFKFTERYLTIRHNIQYFVMSSGHKNDLTPFLKRLKFRPFEQLYIKTLGD